MLRFLILIVMLCAAWPGNSAETTPARVNRTSRTLVQNGVRLTKYIIGVADLVKSYAFYRALGIDFEAPGAKIKPPAMLPDMVRNLVAVPAGAKFRNVMLKIPGADFPLEATEFTAMEVKPGHPRAYDPGAAILILTVHDISVALATAKKAGGEVVTLGGAPLMISSSKTRSVLVKDPDSFYVEFAQESQPTASGSNIVSARFAAVVADAEKSAEFYRAHFGLDMKLDSWSSDKDALRLAGLASGQMRAATLKVPGSTLEWSLIEYKARGISPYRLRIPDPGAPAVGFEVRDLNAAFEAMKSNGGAVITVDEKPLQGGKGEQFAFTRDPSGILVELAQGPSK